MLTNRKVNSRKYLGSLEKKTPENSAPPLWNDASTCTHALRLHTGTRHFKMLLLVQRKKSGWRQERLPSFIHL